MAQAFFVLRKKRIFLLLLCLTLLFLRGRIFLWHNPFLADRENYIFRGCIIKDPERGYKQQSFVVKNKSIRVLLYTSLLAEYHWGDCLEIRGDLQACSSLDNKRYGNYLRSKRIDYVSYYPDLKLLAEKKKILNPIYNLRAWTRGVIEKGMGEPEASLAVALLLGYREALSPENETLFARLGLSHMIAISGGHISLLANLLLSFLGFFALKKKPIFYLSAGLLSLYVLMTGLEASALRSLIMGLIALRAKTFSRPDSFLPNLFIAAALMLFVNPMLWRYDLGFQLSFLAVLGIYYLEAPLKRIFRSQVLAMTLAAEISTWPLIAFSFETFSLIAPLANILVLWTFSYLLPLLFLDLFLSFLFPRTIFLFSVVPFLLLKYIFLVSNFLGSLSFAAVEIKISLTFLIVYYLLFFSYFFSRGRRKTKKPL